MPKAFEAVTLVPPPPTASSTLASLRNVTRSDMATCFIVPSSFVTKRSAATKVVEDAEVFPSMILISAVVAVTPSMMFSSAVEATNPSRTFNSFVLAVIPSKTDNSD